MGRRKKYRIEDLRIDSVGDKGVGIGRHEGKVIFVEGGVPGDRADVFVFKDRRDYAQARYERLLEPSPLRTQPFCRHFEYCGGCKWQHVRYEGQLEFKQRVVSDALQRIGNLEAEKIHPIIPSEKQKYYRNKLEFTFSENRWLTPEEMVKGIEYDDRRGVGFHVRGAFDKVLDIEECWLQEDLQNQIRNHIRKYAFDQDLSFFNIREQHGWLRNLIIRNTLDGQWMVVVSVFYEDEEALQALMDDLHRNFPQVTTLIGVVNPKKNDTLYDLEFKNYYGPGFIIETLGDIQYRIGPITFFQTNPAQARVMYDKVKEMANLSGGELVFDLYTGTGSIALYLARFCKSVVGVESIPEAVEHANENAMLNDIDNCRFLAGDMKALFTAEFFDRYGRPDVIITDPPRAGMHEKVCRQILESGAKKIVYVSCNPATQARDMAILSEKYALLESQAIDMFPHTYHVENIALLHLKV